MNIAFPWPYSQGEWFAWGVAAATVLIGLVFLLFPRAGLRALGVRAEKNDASVSGIGRSVLGGFPAGSGLAAILLAQPLLYFALGLAWAFAALGWGISIAVDGNNGARGFIGLIVAVLLAFFPLAFAFGLLP